jgi:hypothetical protein
MSCGAVRSHPRSCRLFEIGSGGCGGCGCGGDGNGPQAPRNFFGVAGLYHRHGGRHIGGGLDSMAWICQVRKVLISPRKRLHVVPSL